MLKFKKTCKELKAETKRITWPDRKRLVTDTAAVLAVALVLGGFLSEFGGICDIGTKMILQMF